DELGIDTMSVGVIIGFAMELFERGYITKKDTGGLELKFGNGVAMVNMIEKIAKREDIGDLLAEDNGFKKFKSYSCKRDW
ncbi:unnamed protein product, partial [marine sediment metagenome]